MLKREILDFLTQLDGLCKSAHLSFNRSKKMRTENETIKIKARMRTKPRIPENFEFKKTLNEFIEFMMNMAHEDGLKSGIKSGVQYGAMGGFVLGSFFMLILEHFFR